MVAQVAVDSETLKRLSQLEKLPTIKGLGLNLLAIAGLYGFAVIMGTWWAYGLSMLGMAMAQHGLAVLMHEAAHWRMWPNRQGNEILGKIAGWPIGVSLIAYRQLHKTHHARLYTPVDPDLPLFAGYPRGRAYLWKKLARDLFGLTTLKNFAYLTGRLAKKSGDDPSEQDHRPSNPLERLDAQAKAELKKEQHMLIYVHIGVLALAFLMGQGINVLLLWYFPILTFLQVLLRIRALAEHGAMPETTNPIISARTVIAGPVLKLAIFPHNVHYHTAHHLFPSVPCYHLPQAHKALEAAGVISHDQTMSFGTTIERLFAARV